MLLFFFVFFLYADFSRKVELSSQLKLSLMVQFTVRWKFKSIGKSCRKSEGSYVRMLFIVEYIKVLPSYLTCHEALMVSGSTTDFRFFFPIDIGCVGILRPAGLSGTGPSLGGISQY